MKRSNYWSFPWVFYLTAGCIYAAVVLRVLLVYQGSPALGKALGPLAIWLLFFIVEPDIHHKWSARFPWYFLLYLIVQTSLTLWLLYLPEGTDFISFLFAILSMQAMLRLSPIFGAAWIGLWALVIVLPLIRGFGTMTEAAAFAMINTAVNVFLASYALATRRAQLARFENQSLALELQENNQKLQVYSQQLKQLASARERDRLARELHDAVTQTIFTMNLTVQSTGLLLASDKNRAAAQLEHLSQLSRNALSEIQELISQLRPEQYEENRLALSLRRHLSERLLPEGLQISLEVEGDYKLGQEEEQGLFRIVQEGLNNIVKHSQATQAWVRLYMKEPFWVEIEDQGRGFNYQQAQASGGFGLASMRERAEEIGWDLKILTSPGAGTSIRVEKKPS